MRICPYISFNGNCEEAVRFYEKALNAKAEIMRYKDAPPEDGSALPEGTEDFVMHTWLKVGDDPIGTIGMADTLPGNECSYGDGVVIHIGLESADAVKAVFEVLKEGGEVYMELQQTFFSEWYGMVKDKFGVYWQILQYSPQQ